MDRKQATWIYILLSAIGLMVAGFHVAGTLQMGTSQTIIFAVFVALAIGMAFYLCYKYYQSSWYEFPTSVNIAFILNIFSLPLSTIIFAASQVYLADFMLYKNIRDAIFVNFPMCVSLFFSILWVLSLIYIRASGYAEE